LVFIAADVLDVPFGELAEAFDGLVVEGLESWGFHAVLAGDLTDEQLGVAVDIEVGALESFGLFERVEESLVFGDVVGALAQEVAGFV
jgi:hypothetical protein